jgi:hypothetical protein
MILHHLFTIAEKDKVKIKINRIRATIYHFFELELTWKKGKVVLKK